MQSAMLASPSRVCASGERGRAAHKRPPRMPRTVPAKSPPARSSMSTTTPRQNSAVTGTAPGSTIEVPKSKCTTLSRTPSSVPAHTPARGASFGMRTAMRALQARIVASTTPIALNTRAVSQRSMAPPRLPPRTWRPQRSGWYVPRRTSEPRPAERRPTSRHDGQEQERREQHEPQARLLEGRAAERGRHGADEDGDREEHDLGRAEAELERWVEPDGGDSERGD